MEVTSADLELLERRVNPTTPKIPATAWMSIGLSIMLSLITLAYTTGVQAQRIRTLEVEVEAHRTQIIQTPAMLNELNNINRRLSEMKTSLDNLTSRR
jgi:hypothetical protein